jgi:hypothetical protein
MIEHASFSTRHLSSIRAFLIALFATLVLAAPAGAATAEQGDLTGLESWAAAVALGEVGQAESSENWVSNGRGYGDFGGAWCGDFAQWVLERSNVNIYAGGRPSGWNFRLARNWSFDAWLGYGRKRPASTKDAVPGDFIVHNDNGTRTAGGHVSMVVKNTNNPAIVWTVGGNEGGGHAVDGVRLRQTNLDGKGGYTYGRTLVTITEMRYPSTDLKFGTGTVGSVQFDRISGAYGPLVKVNGLKYGSTQYTTSQIDANYRLEATNRDTGVRSRFMPRNYISTINYRDIRIVRISGSALDSAQVTHPGPNLSGKQVSSAW